MDKYETFTVIVPIGNGEKEAYIIQLIGYNKRKIGNIYTFLSKIINGSIESGINKCSSGSDIINSIISDAWRFEIHLEAICPTFGTFDYTKQEVF